MLHNLQFAEQPVAEPEVKYGESCQDEAEYQVEGLKRHTPEVHGETSDGVFANHHANIESYGGKQQTDCDERDRCPDEGAMAIEQTTQHKEAYHPDAAHER